MHPHDRCCCSHFAGPLGCFVCCFGPPIRSAARGACIFLFILSIPEILGGISLLIEDNDVCQMRSAEKTLVASLAINIIAILIYGWGVWVAHIGSVSQAQVLWKAHIFISCLSIPVGVCINGSYAQSPRRKDPTLNEQCLIKCRADAAANESPFGDQCEISYGHAWGWVMAAITTVIWGYLAFILWSFALRAKEGTIEMLGTEMAVMAPTAIHHQPDYDYQHATAIPMAVAVAVAVPVGVAAVPVGVATGANPSIPTATPIALDPNSNQNEQPPAYHSDARYEPPVAYATDSAPPRYPV